MVGVRVRRVERNGSAEICEGPAVLARPIVGIAANAIRRGKARVEANRLATVGDCPGVLSPLLVGAAAPAAPRALLGSRRVASVKAAIAESISPLATQPFPFSTRPVCRAAVVRRRLPCE